MRVPLLGGAYQAKSIIANAQRCVNLYPEANPQSSQALVPVTHYPRPGLDLLASGSALPWRCLYRTSQGELYGVIGNNVYYVPPGFVLDPIGTIPPPAASTPISMADNGNVIILVDGSPTGYAIDLETRDFGEITDSNFLGADRVDYLDTFFILNRPRTNQFYTSLSNVTYDMLTSGTPGTAFDALDIAAKTSYPDQIASLIVMFRGIWLVGTLTTEVWQNVGAANFTFQQMPGVFIEHGCVAKYSLASQDLCVYWLSEDKQGQRIVVRGKDYNATRISTHALENEISAYEVVSDAIGFTYQQEGHVFYVLTFPSADKTWVYDESTSLWHEESSTDSNGFLHRHRANCMANAYGKNVAGDWQNGRLYSLNPSTYTDNGDPITRIRSFPHGMDNNNRVSYRQFVADMEVGTDTEVSAAIPPVPVADQLEQKLQAICLIPGAGEFVYATEVVTDETGTPTFINMNNPQGVPDVMVALDQLEERFPNLTTVIIVFGWFGLDLRVEDCTIMPGVEQSTKTTTPISWRSGGVNRSGAHVVSQIDGSPAYGGTPSEQTIVQLVAELKSRGYQVGLYPFIFMDIPDGNSLPNPYGGVGQPAYPWRGRITCNPAPGEVGTVDQTAAAATQVDAFFGTSQPSDWSVVGGELVYSGPAEWSFRKFIFYCAALAEMAGGVDLFIMGSELRGITSIRDSATTFPAPAGLVTMAADCAGMLTPGTRLTYSADWSEYFGYHPNDSSNDVFFNLDPVWADENITHIGIDWYAPLADWRDDPDQLDALAGYSGPYEMAYIMANVAGGEYYDWYYADQTARDNQDRTTITDGGYNKPWVFRTKDLVNWWSNLHYDRIGGIEVPDPTAWVPESKPIELTEFGCPAINKGSNQPNVFVDVKSSESEIPYYSNGSRDDLNQRIACQGILNFWDDPLNNPVSTVYDAPMIASDGMSVWCWDARPFPEFPNLTTVWSDGPNYSVGHWLEGRSTADALTPVSEPLISLRWSDTRGASWGNSITQSMGRTGEYLVNLQWTRLGMARDRVFELSWSAPCKTALNGAWVETQEAAS